jgi:predicted permease
MDSQTQTILTTTMAIFLIVAIGFVTRRAGIIRGESEGNILKLAVWVLVPCFILSKVPGNPSLQNPLTVAGAMGAGFLIVAASFAVCYVAGRMIGMTDESGVGTFGMAAGLQNFGFIPVPLIESLFPEQGDRILGVLFVHNLGVEFALWTLGIMMLSGSAAGAWKRLINGPSIAITVGLILNYVQPWNLIPTAALPIVEVFHRTVTLMGVCAIPISVMLVGVTLSGVLEREKWKPDWRVILALPVLRFAILPAMILLIASQVTFSNELTQVLIVQAAMPTGIFPIVLSQHYGGKVSVAVQVAVLSSALSLVLTPLLLTLGLHLVGNVSQ